MIATAALIFLRASTALPVRRPEPEFQSPVILCQDVPGLGGSAGSKPADMWAKEMQSRNNLGNSRGRNGIRVERPGGGEVTRFEFSGSPHYSKTQGKNIATPHVTVDKLQSNTNPATGQVFYKQVSSEPRPMMASDFRPVTRIIDARDAAQKAGNAITDGTLRPPTYGRPNNNSGIPDYPGALQAGVTVSRPISPPPSTPGTSGSAGK